MRKRPISQSPRAITNLHANDPVLRLTRTRRREIARRPPQSRDKNSRKCIHRDRLPQPVQTSAAACVFLGQATATKTRKRKGRNRRAGPGYNGVEMEGKHKQFADSTAPERLHCPSEVSQDKAQRERTPRRTGGRL